MRLFAAAIAATLTLSAPASASTLLTTEGSASLFGWQAVSQINRDNRLRSRNARGYRSADFRAARRNLIMTQQTPFPTIQQYDLRIGYLIAMSMLVLMCFV